MTGLEGCVLVAASIGRGVAMTFDNWLNRFFKSPTSRRSRGKLDHPAPLECCEQRVLLSGTGVFVSGGDTFDAAYVSPNVQFNDVALGDLDGNGTIDAFTVDSSAPSRVWRNDGSGAFVDTGQRLGDFGSAARDIALADLDNDGDLDAFIARDRGAFPSGNQIWLNDGAGNFTDSGQSLGNSFARAVVLADLDGDSESMPLLQMMVIHRQVIVCG